MTSRQQVTVVFLTMATLLVMGQFLLGLVCSPDMPTRVRPPVEMLRTSQQPQGHQLAALPVPRKRTVIV